MRDKTHYFKKNRSVKINLVERERERERERESLIYSKPSQLESAHVRPYNEQLK